jgi:dTDP-4-amino-4,6-dideoxygalactose transaminase
VGFTTTATYADGLIPVFADLVPSLQLLSTDSVLNCVTDLTLAVVVTHLYGGLADVSGLREALRSAGRPDILVIEDCAQAHGAGTPGKLAGSLGDIAAFSFYPTKNLGAMGDAGAIVTSSDELAAIAGSLHQYGWSSKYTVAQAGGRNSRMDEVQATILTCLLPHLQECNEERAAILARYSQACPSHVRLLERSAGSVIHLAVAMSEQRNQLRMFLGQKGISTDIHYPILDCDQPGWQSSTMRIAPQGISQTRASSTELLSLPCFVGMTADEIDQVCQALNDYPRQ